jgi:hypothetical protein
MRVSSLVSTLAVILKTRKIIKRIQNMGMDGIQIVPDMMPAARPEKQATCVTSHPHKIAPERPK